MSQSDKLPAEEEQKLIGLVNLETIQYKANLKRQGSVFDPNTAEILSTVSQGTW